MKDSRFSPWTVSPGGGRKELHTTADGSSRLFLTEFLIVLFFFLIVSSVCLRLFARAHEITVSAEALSRGQTLAASIAEVLEHCGGDLEDTAAYFPEACVSGEELLLGYDETFEACPLQEAVYTMTVTLSFHGQETGAHLNFRDSRGTVIYGLSFTFHRAIIKEEVLS